MLSNELYYRVDKISGEKVDINGYTYTKISITVPKDIKLPAYVSDRVLSNITEGKYFYSKKAYLTGIGGNAPIEREISFRLDYTAECSEVEYTKQKETVVNINCLVRNGKKNVLKFFGPMLVPTTVTTAVVFNEKREIFYVMLVGFHSRAKKLIELGKSYCADIVGNLSLRNPDKPCSIVVQDITFREGVK